ncbi:MAG: phosphonate ABC transporter substrate-binding protein [Rhodobacterales bacterium]|nr:phosphonate ABC transporter substrate-binding protein [Rhodobacterales bacterium]
MLFRKLAAAAAAVVMTASVATANAAEMEGDLKEINFGIISTESTQNLKSQWLPFLAEMETSLGVPVHAFFAPDYAGIIEGMRFNKVQVAWFGNKSALEAVDRAGAEVFVQTSGVSDDGQIEMGYYSVLLTHKDSPLNSLDDVLKCDKTLNFGLGDPNSTSGYLVPSYYVFAKHSVDPKSCYKTVRNANHETNLMAVANKQVDFATNNTEQLERTKKNAPDAFNNVKVIWKSPLIPKDPITYRADLPREWKTRIKAFFLGYGRFGPNAEHERMVLKGISNNGLFYESNNTQLYPIRQLGLFKDRTKLVNDDRMDKAERDKRIAEIDRKLEILRVLSENTGPVGQKTGS